MSEMKKITLYYTRREMLLIEGICRLVHPELPIEEAFTAMVIASFSRKTASRGFCGLPIGRWKGNCRME